MAVRQVMRRIATVVALLATFGPAEANAETGVIVARTSPDVVLVWRVNEAIGVATQTHPSVTALEETLTSRAIGVMVRAMPADAVASAAVSVKLVYFNDGGYDPAYRIETVSGVRRVGEISSTVDEVRRNAKRWQAGLARGRLASGLIVHFDPAAFTGL